MKLSDLLDSPQAHHVRDRRVNVRVLGLNARGEVFKAEEAPVALRFVNEQDKAEAHRDADRLVREQYADAGDVPEDRREEERIYHVLFRALRCADEPAKPWADTVLQLKRCVTSREAMRLWNEYKGWEMEEFPAVLDPETFSKLVEDAKKNFLPDLLKSYGFNATVTAAVYFARQAGSGK